MEDRKKLVNQSIDYILQHLDDELSLDTLSARFFISKYHFARLFRQETGEWQEPRATYRHDVSLGKVCHAPFRQ